MTDASRSEFTLDIIRPNHVVFDSLNVVGMRMLVCEHVGGVIGYGFGGKLDDMLTVLNHADPLEHEDETETNWFSMDADENNQTNFAEGVFNRELDVICRDGSAIGYLLRDNTASYYLITLLNGSHLATYETWLAEYQKVHADA